MAIYSSTPIFSIHVDGVDISPYVEAIDVEYMRPGDFPSIAIRTAGSVLTESLQTFWTPNRVAEVTVETRPKTHDFIQDTHEEAQLCGHRELGNSYLEVCGMWPEHHNHTGNRGLCVCQQCMPDAEIFREYSSYTRRDIPEDDDD